MDDSLPDATPCGVVTSVGADGLSVVLDGVQRLQSGDRVRLADESGAGPLAYVKLGAANTLGLFADLALATPARLAGLKPGTEVIRLARDDYAVVLALNHYLSPTIKMLNGALEDARQFACWARQVACVPDDQVRMVPSASTPIADLASATPTLEAAFGTFSELGKNRPGGKPWGQRLYIFCSGHGIMPLQGGNRDYREAALLLAGASLDNNYGPHIPTRGCAEYFRANGLFKEVVLLVDCCRDEKTNIPLTPIMLRAIAPLTEGQQFYALSTEMGNKSYEKEFGQPPVWRGVFSYHLLRALNDPTLCDDTGILSGSLLRDRIYDDLPQLGEPDDSGTDRAATPIDYDPKRMELMLLRRRGFQAARLVVEFDAARQGEPVQLWGPDTNGRLTYLTTVPVGAGGIWTAEVGEKKVYKVVDAKGVYKLIEAKGGVTNEQFA